MSASSLSSLTEIRNGCWRETVSATEAPPPPDPRCLRGPPCSGVTTESRHSPPRESAVPLNSSAAVIDPAPLMADCTEHQDRGWKMEVDWAKQVRNLDAIPSARTLPVLPVLRFSSATSALIRGPAGGSGWIQDAHGYGVVRRPGSRGATIEELFDVR